jgi:folate-binding protein YgfZ
VTEDYQAIRSGAVVGPLAPRAQVAVTGQDRASYLQGLLTNDIVALAPGGGCYSAWLTPHGRMLTDMHVLESGGMILLDLPAETASATVERLEQFIFTEDVTVGSMADSLTSVWIHGPGAAATVERALGSATGLAGWRDYQHTQFELDGQPISVARIDQLGVPGFCVYVERSRAAHLTGALQAAGAVMADAGALEAARIEAGYPLFGIDMNETTIPLEAGIEQRAISFTKGCYVGQEIIIRVLHRGGGRVARKLVAMRIDGAGAVRGAKLFAGEREIGEVTSAAESPGLGPIALGYVHRDFTAAGASIEVAVDSGRVPAVVDERPMRAFGGDGDH